MKRAMVLLSSSTSLSSSNDSTELSEKLNKNRLEAYLRKYLVRFYPFDTIVRYLNVDAPAAAERHRYCAVQTLDGKWYHLSQKNTPTDKNSLRACMLNVYYSDRRVMATLHVGQISRYYEKFEHNAQHIAAVERELILDLDLRDWANRRSLLCACDRTSACRKCWLLIELAAVVCRRVLGGLYGLGEMLVVFSGGKGAHFYFGNADARSLHTSQRKALIQMFMDMAVTAPKMPALSDMVSELGDIWRQRMHELELLNDIHSPLMEWLKTHANPAFEWNPDPRVRWHFFESSLSRQTVHMILLHFAWPVVDMNAMDSNHLIKAPFSVHTNTHRLALPLDSDMLAHCNPPEMPTFVNIKKETMDKSVQAMEKWLQKI